MALLICAGCTTGGYHSVPSVAQQIPQAYQAPTQAGLQRLAADVGGLLPGVAVLSAPSYAGTCAEGEGAVIRLVLPERILFGTASDQPGRQADTALDLVAQSIRRDAPAAELTVLGHTDAIGSDAYNIALSRRRAEAVLRALVARSLQPRQLSGVAIGKRQPIADNDTPEGREQNRRVEFLVSPCLAANLAAIKQVTVNPALIPRGDADAALNSPLDVLRLQPTAADSYELRTTDAVSLKRVVDDLSTTSGEARLLPDGAATRKSQAPTQASRLLRSSGAARPSPSPAYEPKSLAPDAAQNPLGPAISY